jgi:hypothetical protein
MNISAMELNVVLSHMLAGGKQVVVVTVPAEDTYQAERIDPFILNKCIRLNLTNQQTAEQIEADIAEAWAQRKRVTP